MEQRELFDKYKVIFLDDCFDTKAGSISNRLEKLYQSLGTRLNKGPEILENISSGCEGQGTAKMFDFVERAEKCSTYAQLQELDRNLGAKKQSRDLWRHIKSPF